MWLKENVHFLNESICLFLFLRLIVIKSMESVFFFAIVIFFTWKKTFSIRGNIRKQNRQTLWEFTMFSVFYRIFFLNLRFIKYISTTFKPYHLEGVGPQTQGQTIILVMDSKDSLPLTVESAMIPGTFWLRVEFIKKKKTIII